jgi:AmiR/NasT family two-component response regulator
MGGAINIYATRPNAFDDAACQLSTAFAAFAAVAVGNLARYSSAKREAEELQQAMASRAEIEQAKGLLMGEHGCTADEAFQIMVRLSQTNNVKLRDVAVALVYHAAPPR